MKHQITTTLGTFQFQWVRYDKRKEWWIAGKFLNPGLASLVYFCNPFTGKYNFFAGGQFTALDELRNFLEDLKQNNRLDS